MLFNMVMDEMSNRMTRQGITKNYGRVEKHSFIILIVLWQPQRGDETKCAVVFSYGCHLVNMAQWWAVH
jgi:hypothetical protein